MIGIKDIVRWIILLAAAGILIFWLFAGESSVYNRLKGGTYNSIDTFLPEVSVGAEKIRAERSLSPDIKDIFIRFVYPFRDSSSIKESCIYFSDIDKGISTLFSRGYKVSLIKVGEDTSRIDLINSKRQVVANTEKMNFNPCIIENGEGSSRDEIVIESMDNYALNEMDLLLLYRSKDRKTCLIMGDSSSKDVRDFIVRARCRSKSSDDIYNKSRSDIRDIIAKGNYQESTQKREGGHIRNIKEISPPEQ